MIWELCWNHLTKTLTRITKKFQKLQRIWRFVFSYSIVLVYKTKSIYITKHLWIGQNISIEEIYLFNVILYNHSKINNNIQIIVIVRNHYNIYVNTKHADSSIDSTNNYFWGLSNDLVYRTQIIDTQTYRRNF